MPTKSNQSKLEEQPASTFHYDETMKQLAREGHKAERRLWGKILASVAPEVEAMLQTQFKLRETVRLVNPEDYDYYIFRAIQPSWLLDDIEKATCLTKSDGVSCSNLSQSKTR